MLAATPPIALGDRVIRVDGGDFRVLTVIAGTPHYLSAAGPGRGGECAAPGACFLAVPADWPDPPPVYFSEADAVEAAYSGPIPAGTLAAARARDAALPALTRRLDAAEAWLGWVRAHLQPLAPARFAPQLVAAQTARETALRHWLSAAETGQRDPAARAAE